MKGGPFVEVGIPKIDVDFLIVEVLLHGVIVTHGRRLVQLQPWRHPPTSGHYPLLTHAMNVHMQWMVVNGRIFLRERESLRESLSGIMFFFSDDTCWSHILTLDRRTNLFTSPFFVLQLYFGECHCWWTRCLACDNWVHGSNTWKAHMTPW